MIRRMFLDPSASHLIITTTLGENFYLHTQSKQPRQLSRLKGISIECIAWNPSTPTASTREILVGSTDGNVYEVYIETSTEFYRRERAPVQVWRIPDGAVTGIWADTIPGKAEFRRVIVASHGRLCHWVGKTGSKGRDGSAPIYQELFQREAPVSHMSEGATQSAPSVLVTSPDDPDSTPQQARIRSFAWLASPGIMTGSLFTDTTASSLGKKVFDSGKFFPRSIFPETMSARGGRKLIQDPIVAATLTQFHVLALSEGRILAVNRLNGKIVYDQAVMEQGQTAVALLTDIQKNTFWLFTNQEIFEVVAHDEARDVWRIMLENQDFEAALRYAKGTEQKDSVASASGDHLSKKGQFLEAARVWGKSSKAFEEVCLSMIDNHEENALRQYLLTKLGFLKKSSVMQRVMIASWLVQLFMAKLNSLDDMVATKAELSEHADTKEVQTELAEVKKAYQDFVNKFKSDLDSKTVYEIIGSHDREEELLFFANAIADYNFVLEYWVQREQWTDALTVLNRKTDVSSYYKYGSVLMTHVASGLVDILTRQTDIDPQKLIPALLSYNESADTTPLSQNQAVRYLQFVISNYTETNASIHNTLISIMASHPTTSESSLLSYLKTQPANPSPYDADFALRLCIAHNRIQSCVFIYESMHQYMQAVSLALQYNDIDLAALTADSGDISSPKLRKKLWLLIAEKKIKQDSSIKSAIQFLKRCDLLRIEDLIPFFPDFVVIDDFKEEICAALEDYSRHIDSLKQEMDVSAHTAEQIKAEIKGLDMRYAVVEPGERCWICGLPVLSRQFFVFPCQHAFHSDCLGKRVLEGSGMGKRRKIRDLQGEVNKGIATGTKRDAMVRELDGLVAEQCVLCGDMGIKMVDEPFIRAGDNVDEWAL